MRVRFIYICLLVGCFFCSLSVQAETIRLKSGKTVQGTIIFRNEEVVVFKDASGARYQYVLTDIESITSDDEKDEEVVLDEVDVVTFTGKKVAVSLQLAGGGAAIPGNRWGGIVSGDLFVGANNMFGKGVFMGGGLGYHAYIFKGETLSFLPIQLRAEVPLIPQSVHAPLLALSAGYGVSLAKDVKGGLCAGADFGWKYQFSPKSAFYLGVFANFQNAKLTVTETVSDVDYTSLANRNICGFGAKASLYF